MAIFEYIEKNKEWLFSGVGVVVLGLIIKYFWSRISPHADRKAGPVVIVQIERQDLAKVTASQAETPASITKITSITLAEIAAALERAPPLQRDDVAKRYKGLMVQWETKFWNAEMKDDDNVRLTLDFGPNDMHLVYCSVQLSEYKELGVLPKGAPITVMGRIQQVERRAATLEDVQLFFHGPFAGEST